MEEAVFPLRCTTMKGKKNKCDYRVKAEKPQLHLLDDYFKEFFRKIKSADNDFCGTFDRGKFKRLLNQNTGCGNGKTL